MLQQYREAGETMCWFKESGWSNLSHCEVLFYDLLASLSNATSLPRSLLLCFAVIHSSFLQHRTCVLKPQYQI